MNPNDSRTARRLEVIEKKLTEKAMTGPDLAAEIFMVPESAYQYVRNLRKLGMIHIESYSRADRHITPRYRWGPGVDAKRPKPLTSVQIQRAMMKRIRKDPDRREIYLAKQRARYLRDNPPAPDPLLAALFVGKSTTTIESTA